MLQPVGAMAAASHRLVIEPRVGAAAAHCCALCPENLCKVGAAAATSPGIGLLSHPHSLGSKFQVCK